MSDIVERLRERATAARKERTGTADGDVVHFEEAADEIERLRGDNERLLVALTTLDALIDFSEPASDDKPWIFEDWSGLNEAFELARAALTTSQRAEK